MYSLNVITKYPASEEIHGPSLNSTKRSSCKWKLKLNTACFQYLFSIYVPIRCPLYFINVIRNISVFLSSSQHPFHISSGCSFRTPSLSRLTKILIQNWQTTVPCRAPDMNLSAAMLDRNKAPLKTSFS